MAPTFRQLQYFVTLAEELNFGRAAQRLHISQPPLSAAIKQLEQDLGAQLFERDSKKVSLTPVGCAFETRARRMLAYLDETVSLTRRAAKQTVVRPRVGFIPSMLFRRLPEFVADFEAKHPLSSVELRQMHSDTQIDGVIRGQIDVGFVHDTPLPDGVDSLLLMVEPIMCCVPDSHRLARASFIQLQDLAGERFILFARERAPTYHDRLIGLVRQTGETSTIAYEVDHWLTALAMVGYGMGVALMGHSMMQFKAPGVSYVAFDKDHGLQESRCIWLKDTPSEAATQMVACVRDVIEGRGRA